MKSLGAALKEKVNGYVIQFTENFEKPVVVYQSLLDGVRYLNLSHSKITGMNLTSETQLIYLNINYTAFTGL